MDKTIFKKELFAKIFSSLICSFHWTYVRLKKSENLPIPRCALQLYDENHIFRNFFQSSDMQCVMYMTLLGQMLYFFVTHFNHSN